MFAPLTALMLLTCNDQPLAPSSAAGVTLTLSVTHSAIRAGERDTITVALANTTRQVVALHFPTGCQLLPYITNDRGSIVLPAGGAWGCTANLSQLDLAAGERHTWTFVWTGSTEFASEMPLLPLPAGAYSINATLSAHELRLAAKPVFVQLR
jgi:hypothetical protein